MAEIPGVAGDNGDHWDVTLDGSGDITGSTVLARLWLEGAPLTDDYKRQLSMSILTAGDVDTPAVVRLSIMAGALPHGRWLADWEVTYQDLSVLTWPNRLGEPKHDVIVLRRKN
jgi:hypothetical protein